jgi:hypothetical protein
MTDTIDPFPQHRAGRKPITVEILIEDYEPPED